MVWAKLAFADPISDLAILSAPDSQDLPQEADVYERFLSSVHDFTVADIKPNKQVRLKVLSLGGDWISCTHLGGPIWFDEQVTESGMSGSPAARQSAWCAAAAVVPSPAI